MLAGDHRVLHHLVKQADDDAVVVSVALGLILTNPEAEVVVGRALEGGSETETTFSGDGHYTPVAMRTVQKSSASQVSTYL